MTLQTKNTTTLIKNKSVNCESRKTIYIKTFSCSKHNQKTTEEKEKKLICDVERSIAATARTHVNRMIYGLIR